MALERWPETGIPDNPAAWLMATAKNRAIDLLRRRRRVERKHEEIGRDLEAEETAMPDLDSRPRRRHRRRPPPADLHRLPSDPVDRGAGGPDAPRRRRIDDRGDRAGLPRPGTDGRPADRAGQADACRRRHSLRGPARRRTCRPPGVGARRRLPRLQRRLRGDIRRRLDAAAALRRGDPSRPHPRRARARRARGPRPAGADGAAGFPPRRPHRPVGRAHPPPRSEPRALGQPAHPPRSRRPRPRGGARPARRPAPCRPRSPPATPARRRPRIPTGRGSRRSMPTSWRSRRRRSPSSTGRWRSPLPSGRPPASRSSTG